MQPSKLYNVAKLTDKEKASHGYLSIRSEDASTSTGPENESLSHFLDKSLVLKLKKALENKQKMEHLDPSYNTDLITFLDDRIIYQIFRRPHDTTTVIPP